MRELGRVVYPRPNGISPIGVKNGIVRIFPTLVGKPALVCAGIFNKAVAVAIAVFTHPAQRGTDVWPDGLDGRKVAGAIKIKACEPDE
jgi:hypothetical protein